VRFESSLISSRVIVRRRASSVAKHGIWPHNAAFPVTPFDDAAWSSRTLPPDGRGRSCPAELFSANQSTWGFPDEKQRLEMTAGDGAVLSLMPLGLLRQVVPVGSLERLPRERVTGQHSLSGRRWSDRTARCGARK
jgi:hypothetical protein